MASNPWKGNQLLAVEEEPDVLEIVADGLEGHEVDQEIASTGRQQRKWLFAIMIS